MRQALGGGEEGLGEEVSVRAGLKGAPDVGDRSQEASRSEVSRVCGWVWGGNIEGGAMGRMWRLCEV